MLNYDLQPPLSKHLVNMEDVLVVTDHRQPDMVLSEWQYDKMYCTTILLEEAK